MILVLLCTSVMGSEASPRTQLMKDLGDTPSPQPLPQGEASPNLLIIRGQNAAEKKLKEAEDELQQMGVARTLLVSEKQLLTTTLAAITDQKVTLEAELSATQAARKQVSEERKDLSEQNRILVRRYALLKEAADMTDADVQEFAIKFNRLAADLKEEGIEILAFERDDAGANIVDDAGQPKKFNRVEQLSDFIKNLSVNGNEIEIRTALKDPLKKQEAAGKILEIAAAIQQKMNN